MTTSATEGKSRPIRRFFVCGTLLPAPPYTPQQETRETRGQERMKKTAYVRFQGAPLGLTTSSTYTDPFGPVYISVASLPPNDPRVAAWPSQPLGPFPINTLTPPPRSKWMGFRSGRFRPERGPALARTPLLSHGREFEGGLCLDHL